MNRLLSAAMVLLGKADAVRPISITSIEGWPGAGDAPSGEIVTSRSVMSLSAAWACVNLLAGTIASLPLMVYRTSPEGARDVARDHPLYRVLHDSPNSLQTAIDFWEFMSASIELWGNGYARKVRSGSRVVSLLPIMPDRPVVEAAGSGRLRYRWTEDGKSYDETSDTVLHIRGFGGNPLGGMSTLSFGAHSFGLALAIDRAAGSTFKNGLHSAVALTFEKWLTGEQRDLVEAKLPEKYIGTRNAGRPLILEGGTKVEKLSINPEDAQMLESRGFSVEEICRFFGVPPIMVGHGEKTSSWGTGVQEVTLGFVKYSLRRRLKRIEQALEKQLLSDEDRAGGITIEFNLEGLLRGDSAGRAAHYTAALGDTQKPGWMVRNEVRRLENLPPIPGWDEPIELIRQAPSPVAPPASPDEE